MLTGKQRPVPSKATLQILYQLAYISSGTAVGVGFLCAEERRRRTQIVQRIADNAKKIRQSPRYAHNAAAAAVREVEEEFHRAPPDPRLKSLDGQAERKQRRRRHPAGSDDGAKGPELPSVVAEAYARHDSSTEGGTAQVRRKHTPKRRSVLLHDPQGADRAASNIYTDGRTLHRSSSVGSTGQSRFTQNPLDFKHFDTKGQSGELQSRVHSLAHERALRHVTKDSEPFALGDLRTSAIHRKDFKTLLANDDAVPVENVPEDEIIHDVNSFQCTARLRHLGSQEIRSIWRDLVTLSARKGLLQQIKLMCRWMRKQSALVWLDHDVVETLCQECETISRRSRPSEVFDFYVGAFDLAKDTSFSAILAILDKALTWDIDATHHERAEALIGKIGHAQQEALFACLSEFCAKTACADDDGDIVLQRSGLREVHTHRQSEMLIAVAPMVKDVSGFEVLLDRVFADALSKDHLNTCARLLRTADNLIPGESSARRYEDFLIACDAREAYSLVRGLFKDTSRPFQPHVTQLRGRCRKIILRAKASHEAITSKTVRAMKLPVRRSVPLILQGLRIRLRHVWRSTYDRDRVNSELRAVRNSVQEYGDDQSRRMFQVANLEFCIFSDQIQPALRALSALYAASPDDPEIISLAAVLLAKRGAWDALADLLARVRKNQLFDNSGDGTRRINAVIGLHTRNFTAAETWKLVTGLVAEHGFRPNLATTEIMLKSFVSQRTIGLIPCWFTYVGSLGAEVRLDSRLVTTILRRYYHDNHPSHVLMMNFCRTLVRLAPMLKGQGYVDVLKESIGYDLRLARSSNYLARMVSPPEHIEARLKRIELLKDDSEDLPGPGKVFDGQLAFGRRESSAEGGLPKSVGLKTPGLSNDTPDRNLAREGLLASSRDEASNSPNDTGRAHKPVDRPANHSTRVADPNERLLEQYNLVLPETATSSVRGQTEPMEPNGHASVASEVRFSDLRQTYHNVPLEAGQESSVDMELGDLVSTPERDMIVAFSTGDYANVIGLYQASFTKAQAMSISPLALEIVVEASLRHRNGHTAEAMHFMKEAHAAGMNATCAMGPMLIHQMRSLNMKDRNDVNRLRTTTIEYYRLNDENGWPVKHHVGVAAASIMINGGMPRYGLNLLDAIFRSESATRRPLEIEAMSVYLQGYAQIRDIVGIKWVVDQVLKQNMRIDRGFCHILKRCARFFSSDDLQDFDGSRRESLLPKEADMRHFLDKCRARRLEQRVGFYKLGKALVKTLVRVAKRQAQPVIDLASKAQVKASVFGVDRHHLTGPKELQDEVDNGNTPQSVLESRLRRRRMAVLKYVGGGRQQRRLQAKASQRRYHRLLQLRMIVGKNTCLGFRYNLTGAQAAHQGKPESMSTKSQDPLDPVGGPPMNVRKSRPSQAEAEVYSEALFGKLDHRSAEARRGAS